MIFSIVFIMVFIVGFAFGIAMPFILKKLGIYKQEVLVEEQEPSTNANEIIDEWLNGKVGV